MDRIGQNLALGFGEGLAHRLVADKFAVEALHELRGRAGIHLPAAGDDCRCPSRDEVMDEVLGIEKARPSAQARGTRFQDNQA